MQAATGTNTHAGCRRWHSITSNPFIKEAVPRARSSRRPSAARAVTEARPQVELRQAGMKHYWACADIHADVFYPDVKAWQGLLMRVDRTLALQINDKLSEEGVGRAACVMALEPGSSLPAQTSPVFPDPQYLVKPFLNPAVHEGLGATYSGSGILGVANVDTFGDLIPPRSLDPFRDGAFGWVKREQMAYISNVAVARSARRRGVATLVMAEAEALAREWGCRSAALHCNPNNTPAWELYTRLGYRKTVQEPPWMPILNQRPGDRCFLMVKRLAAV